jgi:hypothetical protein
MQCGKRMWKLDVNGKSIFLQKKLLIEKHRVQAGKEVKKSKIKKSNLVNFINILQAAFAPIFYRQKIIKPNCN